MPIYHISEMKKIHPDLNPAMIMQTVVSPSTGAGLLTVRQSSLQSSIRPGAGI